MIGRGVEYEKNEIVTLHPVKRSRRSARHLDMGEQRETRAEEIFTLHARPRFRTQADRYGRDVGEGKAEALIGRGPLPPRDQAFLVSKVYPHQCSRKGASRLRSAVSHACAPTASDCTCSLARQHSFQSNLEGLMALQKAGKIRYTRKHLDSTTCKN